MKLRIFYHIFCWLFFVLFLLQLRLQEGLDAFFDILPILAVLALAVYSNLYLLLPRYFFKKSYWAYSFWLLLLINFAAGSLEVLFSLSENMYQLPFLHIYINFSFFIFVSSFLKFLREYFKNQKQLAKIEAEQLKTELALLKMQVSPHFLFNTLNNLYGLIIQRQNEQASELTLALSQLMRYMLRSSTTEKLSLRQEICFIEDYLSLEKIRLSEDIDIRFELSGLEEDLQIAPFLFIPLIENVFKHGLETSSGKQFAHFTLSVQGRELFFEVKNSLGVIDNTQARSGMGLKNLRKRLELLYPQRHLLELQKTDIFTVTLYIYL